jgi:outer membrane immunogenic protein
LRAITHYSRRLGRAPFPAQHPCYLGPAWRRCGGKLQHHQTGWVVGGGVETSIGAFFGLGNNNWSMKLEYLYVDLGNVNNTVGTSLAPITFVSGCVGTNPCTATGTTTCQNHVYEQIIRVGVNYRFSYAAAAPAVTKY